ncbi:hypothetical protein OMK64_13190 [Cellulomonas fimi]|uniref:hypothetical protein n=1 Tax=Cellulomonas fimi TaxID=1708 RepID=UPI00234DA7E1|nr:hypothetical protein [Cellulomonas fimi]MDC7122489.1 hypothetical protein [Cellulomonas fimi]
MDAALIVAVVVAVVAALGSLSAAVWSYRSANRIDQRQHQVAALNDDQASINAAYAAFIAALSETDPADKRKLTVLGEALAAHPRATPALTAAVDQFLDVLSPQNPWREDPTRSTSSFAHTLTVRKEVAAINASLNAERDRATDNHRRRWWRRG